MCDPEAVQVWAMGDCCLLVVEEGGFVLALEEGDCYFLEEGYLCSLELELEMATAALTREF
jgi:hypothetical protein